MGPLQSRSSHSNGACSTYRLKPQPPILQQLQLLTTTQLRRSVINSARGQNQRFLCPSRPQEGLRLFQRGHKPPQGQARMGPLQSRSSHSNGACSTYRLKPQPPILQQLQLLTTTQLRRRGRVTGPMEALKRPARKKKKKKKEQAPTSSQ